MKRDNLQKLILSAMLLALGIALPFLTGQIKEIGDSLLPMHIPVMLCGIICGKRYGLTVGFMLPFIRAVAFGRPPLYPNALWMALELATYGFVIGLAYAKMKRKTVPYILLSLVISMLSGRIVWGCAKAILLGVGDNRFTINAFIVGGFIDAIPGIVLQLILIPIIVGVINKLKKQNT